jgi:DNA-binding GntR family transcriptional regulator
MKLDKQSATKTRANPGSRSPVKVERSIPLYEQIQNALWDKIISGEILPDEHVSDRQWADNLRVSRTPVREALRLMAQDGVLITLDSGGYRVRSVDRAGLLSLYVCRAVLAGAATRETTLRGDKALIKRIGDIIGRNKEALERRDAETILKNSSQFHEAIILGSKNEYLINIMSSLHKMILFYRVSLLKQALDTDEMRDAYFAHLAKNYERHMQIIDAIAHKAADKAAKLMEEHLLATAQDMDHIFASSRGDDSSR